MIIFSDKTFGLAEWNIQTGLIIQNGRLIVRRMKTQTNPATMLGRTFLLILLFMARRIAHVHHLHRR